jgi:cell division septation protein DedD
VQLAALNSRSEADAMAKRLTARGYEAYVLQPAGGAPAIYRVRIGKYGTRREAESVAARLEKEGQFKPWVTR